MEGMVTLTNPKKLMMRGGKNKQRNSWYKMEMNDKYNILNKIVSRRSENSGFK